MSRALKPAEESQAVTFGSPNMQTCQRLELMSRVRSAAEALKLYFGARRVILFGSLASKGQFTVDSDVDLAVEGIEAFDHWHAWWLCEEMIESRAVDLVPVERAEEGVLRAIEQTGMEL